MFAGVAAASMPAVKGLGNLLTGKKPHHSNDLGPSPALVDHPRSGVGLDDFTITSQGEIRRIWNRGAKITRTTHMTSELFSH